MNCSEIFPVEAVCACKIVDKAINFRGSFWTEISQILLCFRCSLIIFHYLKYNQCFYLTLLDFVYAKMDVILLNQIMDNTTKFLHSFKHLFEYID